VEEVGGRVRIRVVGLVRAEHEDGEVSEGLGCGLEVGDDEGEEFVGEGEEGGGA